MKVSRAQHNIFKYKVKKIMATGDEANALIEKEKKIAKKNKMRFGVISSSKVLYPPACINLLYNFSYIKL